MAIRMALVALDDSSTRLAPYDPKEDEPKWTNFQRHGHDQLVAHGVTGLPERGEPFREHGIGHPVPWGLLGLLVATMTLLCAAPPDWNSVRAADELLVMRYTQGDLFELTVGACCVMIALPLGGRTLGAWRDSASAFQFIGESLVIFRSLGDFLLRRALRGGLGWDGVRRRWVRAVWLVLAVPLSVYAFAAADVYSTYRAVFKDGIRELKIGRTSEFAWSDVAKVLTNCDESRRDVYYDLFMADGTRFQLLRDDRQGVAAVDWVDQRLKELEKAKTHLPGDQIERCVAAWPDESEKEEIRQVLSR